MAATTRVMKHVLSATVNDSAKIIGTALKKTVEHGTGASTRAPSLSRANTNIMRAGENTHWSPARRISALAARAHRRTGTVFHRFIQSRATDFRRFLVSQHSIGVCARDGARAHRTFPASAHDVGYCPRNGTWAHRTVTALHESFCHGPVPLILLLLLTAAETPCFIPRIVAPVVMESAQLTCPLLDNGHFEFARHLPHCPHTRLHPAHRLCRPSRADPDISTASAQNLFFKREIPAPFCETPALPPRKSPLPGIHTHFKRLAMALRLHMLSLGPCRC